MNKKNNQPATESTSYYDKLEDMSIRTILECINKEDKSVPYAVEKSIPQIEALVKVVVEKIKNGGRLFYIGAGTSGRLGIVDASECPPTFGVPHDLVVGIIAGGDTAIRKAVEFAEDDREQAWKDLSHYNINTNDVVIGIAASGRTPYVVGGLELCQKNGITTGCITNDQFSEITKYADYPIAIVVGPEFITGSTRMKCGTAQKLVLNMISTSVMIQLGKVKGNKMIDMQLSNTKLMDRGIRILMEELCIEKEEAEKLLKEFKHVRKAINWHKNNSQKT